MNILIINGSCIQTNSSANLCHLAYIRGLLDAGHKVTLLSSSANGYIIDPAMEIPKQIVQHTFCGISLYEKLSLSKSAAFSSVSSSPAITTSSVSAMHKTAGFLKSFVRSLYGIHGIYATFVRKAQKFKSDEEFDYIISLSSPSSSHLLAHKLLKANRIKGKRWIQIWEDPWYTDVYGFNHKEKIRREENRLLSFAEKICYVSPITLENQKKLYPEFAEKMFWQPLPLYYKLEETDDILSTRNSYGYFGDYAPAARDLEPFYKAAKKAGIEVNICGNPCNLFEPTSQIHIYPRLPLQELRSIESRTNILVFLCNRKGGQIPGKIYQYSATNKPILFIMDGTEAEQAALKSYFAKFNRYIFCQNSVEDITRAIYEIEDRKFKSLEFRPLDVFAPANIVSKILEEGR